MNRIREKRGNRSLVISGLFAALLIITLLGGSCKMGESTRFDLVLIDSIQVPDTIVAGVTFNMKFYGTVGPDGCHQFSHFGSGAFDDQNFYVEVWKSIATEGPCPAVIVKLEGRELQMMFYQPGTYTMHLRKPDNTFELIDLIVTPAQ